MLSKVILNTKAKIYKAFSPQTPHSKGLPPCLKSAPGAGRCRPDMSYSLNSLKRGYIEDGNGGSIMGVMREMLGV